MSEAPTQPRKRLGYIVLKNTLLITLGSLFLKVANFLYSIYIIRRLGDDRFGQYSVVLAFVGLFQIFAELGISQYFMREIARDRSKTQSMFFNVVAVRLILAGGAVFWITAAARLAGYSDVLVLGILFYTSSFLMSALIAPLEMILTANERFDYVTVIDVSKQITFILLGAIFLLAGLDFIWLIIANLLSLIPQLLLSIFWVRKHRFLSGTMQLAPRAWLALVRSGLPFGIITLTLSIAFSIDTVMLKAFHPDAMVGWYDAAYGLVFSIMFISHGFKEAIVPSLTRTFASDPKQVEAWYYRTTKVLLLISLPIAVGGMLIASPLVHFLYSKEFANSALALSILVWDVPFLMFSSFCGSMTTIISQERSAARIYTVNALANIVLNAIFIPRYGFIAASFITVITDVIGAFQFFFLLHRQLNLPSIRWILARIVLASGMMGLAVVLLGGLHFILQVALGAVVYLFAVLALRLLDQTEWAFIRKLLGKVGLARFVKGWA